MPALPWLWRIELMGTLRAQRGSQEILRFKTSKVGICLAYCAYYLGKPVPREELVDQVWPDAEPDLGRQSLRQALLVLRRQLEPPGIPAGSVIAADHNHVRLNTVAVTTDVAEYLAAAQIAEQAGPAEQRIPLLARVAALYGGDLLPGYYADWILTERERLAAGYVRLLRLLVSELRLQGEHERALDYALRAIKAEPLREELYHDLLLLYADTGRPRDGLQAYARMKRRFTRELGISPSPELKSLAEQFRAAAPRVSPLSAPKAPFNARAGAPAPVPPPSSPPPLPYRHTRFFGREAEMAALVDWLGGAAPMPADRRLVTLTGPGGAGKTRLAIEAARHLGNSGARRVYFAALADVTERGLLPAAVAAALGLPASTTVSPLDQIKAALAAGATLLVLDNLEHLAEAGADFALALLSALPQLALLVTSRHTLNVEAERVLPVPPLAIPLHVGSPAQLTRFACVQLFVDRAQAVSPDFQVTRRNAPTIAALCTRLEGIPLAIELAAARAGTLAPAQMLLQMDDRFGFLTTQRRQDEMRHRTLRACLEWSFALLSPATRRFLTILTVFRGGWTLAAALAVCRTEMALDELGQLCSRSLVIAEECDGTVRYRLLDSVREYARTLAGEELPEFVNRHAEYYLLLAEELTGHLRGPQIGAILAQLAWEHDNFRAVLTSGIAVERRLQLAAALWRFWSLRGHFVEGAERIEALLTEAVDLEDVLKARVLAALGMLLSRQACYARAIACLEESLLIRRANADAAGTAEALTGLAFIAMHQGEYEKAARHYAEVLDIWRRLDNPDAIAATLNNLGMVRQAQGDLNLAESCFAESSQLYRQSGNAYLLVSTLNNLAAIAFRQGRYAQARGEYEECLTLVEQTGDVWFIAVAQHNLGEAYLRDGHPEPALLLLTRSLRSRKALGDRAGIALSLDSLASVARINGQSIRAVRLLEAARVLRRSLGTAIPPAALKHYEQEAALIYADVSEVELAAARTWAAAASLEQAADYACPDVD